MQDSVYSYPQLVNHLKTKLGDADFAADLRGLARSVPDDYEIATALDLAAGESDSSSETSPKSRC